MNGSLFSRRFGKMCTSLAKWFIVLAVSFTVAGCSLPFMDKPDSKPESTSQPVIAANKSGFGGTGEEVKVAKKSTPKVTNVAEGTGFGGTGVIGTITEFGSVWVNGIEIEYPQDVAVKSNLFDQDSLQIGQQVVVETVIDKPLPWTNKIEVYYPLAGKIEAVKSDHLVVDGKIVLTTKTTNIAPGLKVEVGQYIAVSGYPNIDKSWTATLLSYNPAKKHLLQSVPKVTFSDQLRKISIQASQSQLAAWDAQFDGLPLTLIQTGEKVENKRYLLTAEIKAGKIHSYELNQYDPICCHKEHNTGNLSDHDGQLEGK